MYTMQAASGKSANRNTQEELIDSGSTLDDKDNSNNTAASSIKFPTTTAFRPRRPFLHNLPSRYHFQRSSGETIPSILSGNASSTNFSRSLESPKRDHHNRLERKRRASIKDCYNELRSVLPGIVGSKPSRAIILQRAAQEMRLLEYDNEEKVKAIRLLSSEIEVVNAQTANVEQMIESLQNRLLYGGYDEEDQEERENNHFDGSCSSNGSYSYDD